MILESKVIFSYYVFKFENFNFINIFKNYHDRLKIKKFMIKKSVFVGDFTSARWKTVSQSIFELL